MCGRFAVISTPEMLAAVFGLEALLPVSSMFEVTPRYNIPPSLPILAVRVETAGPAAGRRTPVMLQWGLVPSWAKDRTIGNRLINARAETAAEKPSFRTPLKRKRCIVPADAYYEWKTTGKKKQPYAFRLKDGKPMGLAGLWDSWEGGDGSVLETCALMTTEPNAVAATVHDRMPVIVKPGDYDFWLDPEMQDAAALRDILDKPFPAEAMRCYPVSTQVSHPRFDGPECLVPADPPPGEVAPIDLFD